MQLERTENELIIRETPGCLWIFGLFFAIVGGLFVYGALGGFSDFDRQEAWMLAAAFLMGAAGVAAGVWIIARAPITRVVVNRIENSVVVTQYGLSGRRQTLYDFDEIERFALLEENDHEGDRVWSLAMNLVNGESVKISAFPSHDERFKQNFVFQTNEFMRKQLASVDLIFDLAGEDDAEIG